MFKSSPNLEGPLDGSGANENRVLVVDLREAEQLGPRCGPLARVCGMAALERTILVLARRGYRQVKLAIRPADREVLTSNLQRVIDAGLRLGWIEAGTDRHFWPILEALTADDDPPDEVLYWPAPLTFGRLLPDLLERSAPRDGMLMGVRGEQSVGPALIHLGALQGNPELGLGELERRLAGEGKLQGESLDIEPVLLTEPADTRRAERQLLASLRKDADGIVARLDRHVSLSISRLLMKLPVHPNAVTVVAALTGIACGLIAARGGYWWMLVGAILFQLNSILDGIDGEIARAKLLESHTGQWLDTVSDDLCNVAFVAGAAVGCYRTWGSGLYLALGGVAVAGFIVTAVIMYHYLITVAHSGDLNAYRLPWATSSRVDRSAPSTGLAARLEPLLRRDFFVLLTTVVALVGQLRFMMWLYAAGASSVWIGIVGYQVLHPPRRETEP